MEGRRRMTLYDQMSAIDGRRDSLSGSTLEAVMANHKIPSDPNRHRREFSSSRTLSDIIREDSNSISNAKDKKSWNIFKDKLWLKRTGSAWFSTIHIPALINSNSEEAPSTSNPPEFSGQILTRERFGESESNAPSTSNPPEFIGQILSRERFGESENPNSRRGSFRRDGAVTFRDCLDSDGDDGSECDDWDPAREGTRRLSTILSEEREAEAAASGSSSSAAVTAEDEPVRMSLTLMDLLEENDGQLGFNASQYRTTGYEEEDEEVCKRMKMEKEEDEDEGDEVEEESKRWSIQENCCVCMVRNKGAAFIPCGHTFCRQCSRDVWVSRGHCPLCNSVILEILDLF